MAVYQINPLEDPRWGEFVQRHPKASVFHTPGWLEALRRSYGYEPFVLTTSPPGAELTNGLPICRVESWLTGRRLVSLPFSDHCEPLVDRPEELHEMLAYLTDEVERARWKYIEVRPLHSDLPIGENANGFQTTQTYYFHKLDLRLELDELFHRFHKSCVQRKIRRGEREALTYEEGRSGSLLDKFYHLLLLTRRRHQLPPPPRDWFRNLVACLGENAKIRVVSQYGRPVASILTLRFKDSLAYKYGCSDERFHNLGGMALLFWRAIQEAKREGLREFDLGRSDCHNTGLIAFKDRWGATRALLTYARYPAYLDSTERTGWTMRVAKHIFARVPDGILTAAGKLFYKHIG